MREGGLGGSVGGRGVGGAGVGGGDVGDQKELQEVVGEFVAAAFAEDGGAVAVEREAFGWVGEGEFGVGVDGLGGGG